MNGDEKRKLLKPQEYYRKKIITMVNTIEDCDILEYIYIIVSDIEREDKK